MRKWVQKEIKEFYEHKVISGIYQYVCMFAKIFLFNQAIF